MSNFTVTGAAGFIGAAVTQRLLAQGHTVQGIDNLNDYYDPRLKQDRLTQIGAHPNFLFVEGDLADKPDVARVLNSDTEFVIHLGAQAGVRYSIENPDVYVQSNVVGTMNILEACRRHQVKHLAYASTSSVYGANTHMPFSVHDGVNHPVSLYAATKKANELMAHTYSHLFGLPTTGLRFFTVYGPWGRPDMAMYLFTSAIFEGRPIRVFNNGQMERDFTYIDDIVSGVIAATLRPATPDPDWSSDAPDPATSHAPYRIYNIGNHQPVKLLRLIELIEAAVGQPAIKEFLPMQAGDVVATYADVADLTRDVGFTPDTPIEVGVERYVAWYRDYYRS